MFEDFLRIIGVALVGLVLLLPSGNYLNQLSDRNLQIIAAMVVVTSILFIDAIFGALVGLAVLIWFFKMNHRMLFVKYLTQKTDEKNKIVYGTPKNLSDAQTNVVNEKMMTTEMVGFDSVYGEQVIGAQGLDKIMPGFDKNKYEFLAPLN